jgi:VWFA-related protein
MITRQLLRPVLVAVVLFMPSLSVPGHSEQQKTAPPDGSPSTAVPTIAVDARLVNLPVVVRDKKGALIQNLNKDDFTLQVDGKPQAIRYFDKDMNLPLTLGLLVDTSQSQRSVLGEERTASSTFLDQMLTNPKDQAFIIQFARQTELLQDLTTSRPLLQKALKEIDSPGASSTDDDTDTRSRARGGTVLYDALFLASDELMSKQTGRKALVILSDGVDRNSKENLVRSIEAAQRADTIIYAIYFKGEESHPQNNNPQHGRSGYPGGGFPGGGYPGGGYPGGRGGFDGKKILERMAQETGGRLFEVKKNQDVAQIYNQIAEELRAQYRLGYTPTQEAASNGYHQVAVDLHQKGLVIQTRDGYYGGK